MGQGKEEGSLSSGATMSRCPGNVSLGSERLKTRQSVWRQSTLLVFKVNLRIASPRKQKQLGMLMGK